MGKTVIFASGDKWRSIRNLITPAFTSGKLKSMFPLIEKEADSMVEYCRNKTKNGESLDICDPAQRFSVNVIASCAFGVEGQCFKEDEPPFLSLVQKVVEFKLTFLVIMKGIIYNMSRFLFRLLGFSFVSNSDNAHISLRFMCTVLDHSLHASQGNITTLH